MTDRLAELAGVSHQGSSSRLQRLAQHGAP